MGDEPVRQLGAADALREAGIVVDPVGRAGLAAEGAPLDHERVHPFPGRVDRRRQAGRPTAEDQDVVDGPLRVELEAELPGQLRVGRLEQVAAVGEDDRGRSVQVGSSRRTVATRSIARSNDAMTPIPVRSALATR